MLQQVQATPYDVSRFLMGSTAAGVIRKLHKRLQITCLSPNGCEGQCCSAFGSAKALPFRREFWKHLLLAVAWQYPQLIHVEKRKGTHMTSKKKTFYFFSADDDAVIPEPVLLHDVETIYQMKKMTNLNQTGNRSGPNMNVRASTFAGGPMDQMKSNHPKIAACAAKHVRRPRVRRKKLGEYNGVTGPIKPQKQTAAVTCDLFKACTSVRTCVCRETSRIHDLQWL